MPDTFSPRRLVELDHKLSGLEAELKSWQDRSQPGGPFEKHHSQVCRAQHRLGPLIEDVRNRLKEGRKSGKIVGDARAVEQMILAVHRLWEFFRAKFAQRQETAFAPFLAAVDEFAWACYEPARSLAHPDPASHERREPPLVFFNGGWSPFAVGRDRAYRGEEVPGEPLSGPRLQAVLRSLPVPVVGLPWYQRQHLPDALVVGHEVGHLVEEDFGLTDVIEKAADAVDPKRRDAWKAWSGEVFADVYGCLAGGPAFVSTLMDILAGDVTTITKEKRTAPPWGSYPTDALRILLNLEVLTQRGFTTESQLLAEHWQETYSEQAMTDFKDDIKLIVSALLKGPYPTLQGKALPEVLDFTTGMQTQASQAVRAVREGSLIGSQEIRPLFAAVRLLYTEAPEAFEAVGPTLFDHIVQSLKPGTRAGEATLSEEENALQTTGDLAQGTELCKGILNLFHLE